MHMSHYYFNRTSQTITAHYFFPTLDDVDPETGNTVTDTFVRAEWYKDGAASPINTFEQVYEVGATVARSFVVQSGHSYRDDLYSQNAVTGIDDFKYAHFSFFHKSSVGITYSEVFDSLDMGLVVGSDFADVITMAGDGFTVILAGAGNDTLFGGAGAGHQLGEAGDDRLVGSLGADFLDGGSGVNTLDYTNSSYRVKVDISANTASGGDAEGDTILHVQNVSGSSFNDAIYGHSGVNVLRGYGGNDTLDGRGGFDTLYGYEGNDVLRGGQADDRVSGMNGNDTIEGNEGKDTLSGEAGADAFFYRALGDSTIAKAGQDNILDFSQSDGDRIKLSDIDAKVTASGNNQFTFIGNTAFSGTEGELRYVKYVTETYVYGDVNGDRKVDFAIHFVGAITFVAGDFAL